MHRKARPFRLPGAGRFGGSCRDDKIGNSHVGNGNGSEAQGGAYLEHLSSAFGQKRNVWKLERSNISKRNKYMIKILSFGRQLNVGKEDIKIICLTV